MFTSAVLTVLKTINSFEKNSVIDSFTIKKGTIKSSGFRLLKSWWILFEEKFMLSLFIEEKERPVSMKVFMQKLVPKKSVQLLTLYYKIVREDYM